MDIQKQLDDALKKFNENLSSEFLLDPNFIRNNPGTIPEIILILGKGLTKDTFESNPDFFCYCEKQLLEIAQLETHEQYIFDFLELIDDTNCKLSSSVLITVTSLQKMESPNPIYLEYLLLNTFNRLNEMDDKHLTEILPCILKHLIKINKHFQHDQSLLYYFARVSFFVLRTKMDPVDYVKILSSIINDPFSLLELEFEEIEENLYLASFFYLYFKTEILWGPKIYNQYYILEKCLHLALSVFNDNNFGKYFTKFILIKYKDNQIPLYFLNKCHENFIMEAAHCSIHNDQLHIRRESIESLLIYMDKLCSDAQYIVFKHIFLSPIGSCVKAQMIVKLKDLILLKIKIDQELGYFQGVRLLELLKLCCNIRGGSRCHIVENKEHILAAISFMVILYKYNYCYNLMLDIHFINYIKKFIENIQNAINYTNEEYEVENQKLTDTNHKEIIEVDLNLPEYSKTEKHEMLTRYNMTTRLVQMHLNIIIKYIKDENVQ